MSFSLLGQFFREFDVPSDLRPLAPLVGTATHYRFTPAMDYAANARSIFGPDLGANFRLPDTRVAAVEDAESCVVMIDLDPGQRGLEPERVFILATKLPLHVLPLEGQTAASLRRQIEELQLGGCTIQLVWGMFGQFRVLKDVPPNNMTGKVVPVGWHFQSLSTGFQQTTRGDMNPLMLQLQPTVFSHILTALEQYSVMKGKQ